MIWLAAWPASRGPSRFVLAIVAPDYRPAARHGDEHLDGGVVVQRRPLAWIGTHISEVEIAGILDGWRQRRVLGYSGADDVVDIAGVLGQPCIDKGLVAFCMMYERDPSNTFRE